MGITKAQAEELENEMMWLNDEARQLEQSLATYRKRLAELEAEYATEWIGG